MPTKGSGIARIRETAEKICKEQGYLLFDVALDREHTGRYLRVYIDTERDGGITLDDCEKYHKAFQPYAEDYDYDFLEVCSPGADRPVRTPAEAEKYRGCTVDVKLYRPVNGTKEYCCPLEGMTEISVLLHSDGKILEIEREVVASVRLHPDMSALEEE